MTSPHSQNLVHSNVDRCAILMLSLGEETASEVFKHLNAREIQEIGAAMAQVKNITRSHVEEVLEQFRSEIEQFMAVTLGSNEYVRAVLTRALGSDRAAGVLEDIFDTQDPGSGIDALNYLEATNIAEIITEEHPQIIAAIMVHLDRMKASEVLALLPERVRNDVIYRVATFGGVQPLALHELTEVMNDLLSGQNAKRSKLGGVRTAAEILNSLSSVVEEGIVEDLKARDEDLAQQILDEMFVFENLLDLEQEALQRIMRDVDNQLWSIALKGAPDALQQRIFSCMSKRAADLIQDELEAQGPIRLSRVEQAQKDIIAIARRLADAGEINISSAQDDEYV